MPDFAKKIEKKNLTTALHSVTLYHYANDGKNCFYDHPGETQMAVFGNTLQEYFVKTFRENMKLRRERLAGIANRDEALAYIAEVRNKIRSSFRFPAQKCDLAPRITGKLKIDNDITMEKIIIDSRPDFPVTMNFFKSGKFSGKLPGVLILCGHDPAGKAALAYQTAARSLAAQGAAVLIVDPIHQGERKQFAPEEDPGLCATHNRLHRRMLAYGDNFASWRTWDAIRAVDYLISRDDVDKRRIGAAGCSGGGTLASLLNACDDRITAVAPSCYITSWLANIENELPADAEQALPGVATAGCEMADLLLAAAPRPVLILGKEDDFFDMRGTMEVFREMHSIYKILGCAQRLNIFIAPGAHGLCQSSRERLYQFFGENIGTWAAAEEEQEIIPEKDTFCFPDGKAAGRSVAEIIKEEAELAAAKRPAMSDEEIQDALRKLLGIGEVNVPYYRQLRPTEKPGKLFSRFAIEHGDGLIAVMKHRNDSELFHIPYYAQVELYVPHQDAGMEMAAREESGISGDLPFFGIDYCGVGECMPEGCDQWAGLDFFSEYHFDYHFAAISWLAGKSMTGMRVRDILAAIELLKDHGIGRIRLTASGIGVIPAVLAAFLSDESVTFVPPEEIPEGFLANAGDQAAPIPQSMIPDGILKITDIGEMLRIMAER